MTNRISKSDLSVAFAGMCDAAVKAGVAEAARWHLDIGSKTYGQAYRIWLAHEDYEQGMAGHLGSDWHSGHYTPAVSDYLGMTAAEAFASINTLRSAFLAVVWAVKS
jgi:hypothetical protein